MPKKKKQSKTQIAVREGTREDLPFIKSALIDSWVEHAKNEPDLLDEERMKQSDIKSYYN